MTASTFQSSNKPKINSQQIKLVEQICSFIESQPSPPSLLQLATHFQLSSYYLQRLFKNVVGISPKQYAEQSRDRRLKRELKATNSVTQALYQSGYNSSAALYTQVTGKMGMTPKDYKSGGQHKLIKYSLARCHLGKLLVASTDKGVCMISLGDSDTPLIEALLEEFPHAQVSRDDQYLLSQVNTVLVYLKGQEPHCQLSLDVKGTAFQKQVWDELKQITYGTTCSYEQIASQLGKPKAFRAVANACANNPVALVVPCHRVVRKNGLLGGYRWHLKRKQALIELEENNKEK